MENKLEEYRAKKLREKTINDAKEKFKQIFTFNRGNEVRFNSINFPFLTHLWMSSV